MKALRRLVGALLILLSVATGGSLVLRVLAEPLWQPFVAAGEDQIRAALDRALAEVATPERVAALIEGHLAGTPRNWAALDSLKALAQSRGIVLPMGLEEAIQKAREEDSSWTALAATCAACAWDMTQCPLDGTLICQGASILTPIPDVSGVVRAANSWALGQEIDRFDLALSVVGLTATAAVVVSGGGSGAVKAASGALRVAKGMGRVSARMVDYVVQVSARAIDMKLLAKGDVLKAVRLSELAPLVKTASHLDEVRGATDAATVLQLLPLVDDAEDAGRLARVAKAAGKETAASAEILGKARLFRTTLRWSGSLVRLVLGLVALIGGVAGALGHVALSLAARRAEARARRFVAQRDAALPPHFPPR